MKARGDSGWAGAVFEVTKAKAVKCDQRTDEQTMRGVESRRTQLKRYSMAKQGKVNPPFCCLKYDCTMHNLS